MILSRTLRSRKWCLNKFLWSIYSIPAWCTCSIQCKWQEISCFRINILDRHELLVPDDLLSTVWCWNPHDSSDILQDYKSKWNIFPEEARVGIKNNSIWFLWIGCYHRELNSWITDVRVEYALECWLVTDWAIVHRTDSVFDGQDLWKLQIREFLQ